jgi:hypothetical protein
MDRGMDTQDRAAIEDLFRKLSEVERRSAPREPEAEAFIRSRIAAQPGAPYYMAQTIVAQEQALLEAQRRIEALEARAQRPSGGLLDSLFGGRPRAPAYSRGVSTDYGGPWGGGRAGGGGFLAGAAQTAVGVAGGVVLGNMLADWLSPDEAAAAGLDGVAGGVADDQGADVGGFDADFDAGDF